MSLIFEGVIFFIYFLSINKRYESYNNSTGIILVGTYNTTDVVKTPPNKILLLPPSTLSAKIQEMDRLIKEGNDDVMINRKYMYNISSRVAIGSVAP